ncbi:aspartate--tRNA ligase [Williamsoniiplasma luminosum]|uniref:Aspartate--tRNA ligase n=1 Tax=Williamsoniiplasma luminosum TaxID=214888 RepID=A0A2S0NJH0_9MOLU|nr:aspartate--tRNA ligase [Williamsoniiplasma luminosum]AVP49157.1 MAG: aspartate--tRNA ligase [Williamsoniiplasma luminosum]
MKRTHNCGQLTIQNVDQNVILQGWVKKIRKMGGMTFVDIRDRYGITQLILDESQAKEIKVEFVIEIEGIVLERKAKNHDLPTGEIEVKVDEIKIINKAELTPFQIEDQIESLEDTRLTYRYLDLRRPNMQQNLITRAKLNSVIRKNLENLNFLEVETPIFGKATPEGARDFLVPSRLNENKFYALPQSPQLYKQLLMISGIDRYYQIVKCFRDEDLRIDRQPEFTQLDMEMSFATGEDIIFIIENLMKEILWEIKGVKLSTPFKRLQYKDAIEFYGVDKPDLRYDLKIHDLTNIFAENQIKLFQINSDQNAKIKGVMIDELLNKTQLAELEQVAKQNHLNNLGFVKYENGNWTGSIASQLSEPEKAAILKEFKIQNQGTLLVNKEKYEIISQAMGAIRTTLAKQFNLADPNKYEILWVVDFPLFEFSEEENRYVAAHHPFTMPKKESLQDFDLNKKQALANAYDIVLNGFEIGGGSQRITDPSIQDRMFKAIEMPPETIESNFGWFINAYKYGAPYHAGIALGLDRIAMLLSHAESIRDVIAFPKNSSGIDPMSNAPDYVTPAQLQELNIALTTKKK